VEKVEQPPETVVDSFCLFPDSGGESLLSSCRATTPAGIAHIMFIPVTDQAVAENDGGMR